ncbi:MAG: hypothetical protein RL404_1829 [Pseudomonadota bacterium]|jgi:G3E family GTPase
MTLVTLVHGGSGDSREAAIAAKAAARASGSTGTSAAILEGFAGGRGALQALADSSVMKVIRVAPGCICCTGNLTMRVTLNRVLREMPEQLYLALADASHMAKVREFLQEAQYRKILELGPELDCG